MKIPNLKKITIIIVCIIIIIPILFYFYNNQEPIEDNIKPTIEIITPKNSEIISNIYMITGTASDKNGDGTLISVEIMINENEWIKVEGTKEWNYELLTYDYQDGYYTIKARSWDGIEYSKIQQKNIKISNPEISDTDTHKWAIFIAASNFPENNESKLGNGPLNLMEKMTKYFIENYEYSTSNIFILFDDGWIRKDNGYGKREKTLQQRKHEYAVTYGGATKKNVETIINYVINQANNYEDSEVFLWISSHGCGDNSNKLTGGKIFERSAIFLWDDILTDKDLGDLLFSLKSKKTCVIVDACFSGGFADKTIYNLQEFFLYNSNIPNNGRVIMTGSSKFREGYANVELGPLFSLLWFDGISTGQADGFKAGFLNNGRPSNLKLFKDGKVSVEEAFYYARYILRTDKVLANYSTMEPQINDQYPRKGLIRNNPGLILG